MMKLKQIPNALTLIRFALIAPFLYALYYQQYTYAFYIFFFAGFTDALDGWLARSFHWQSFFGSFVDPIADKLVVTSSFFALALIGSLPWWLVILVFLRDLSISLAIIAWYWFIRKKINFEPTRLSKLNTFFQLTLVICCLFGLAFQPLPRYIIDTLIYLTALTTLITYLDYAIIWVRRAWPKNAIL